MKIVTTADWHLRNSDSYGVYDNSGVNDFLKARLDVCKQIIQKTIELKGHLVIAGDMLDDRVIDSITLYYSSELIEQLSNIETVIILEGNHGYDGKDNRHSIIGHWKHLAKKNIHIVTYPKIITVGNIAYHCLPAIHDVDKNFLSLVSDFSKRMDKSKRNILVFHGPIISAKFDNGSIAKSGVKHKDFIKAIELYDWVVCGDFHRYQQLTDNAWYTGSPLQTSLSDKNQKKGYQIIDTKNNTVKFKKLNGLKFIEAEWFVGKKICPVLKRPEDFKATLKNAVVIIKVYYKHNKSFVEQLELIKKSLLANGAYRVFEDKKPIEDKKKRTTISSHMGLRQMVEAYVKHKRNELPAGKRDVVEAGLRYLHG